MRHRFAVASAAVIALVTRSALAEPTGAEPEKEEAAEGRYPVAEAERPLTLPRFILNPEIDFDVRRLNDAVGTHLANLTVGASFGVTDNLSVRAIVLPLELAGTEPVHYGQTTEVPGPTVGATYRFLHGPVEVGASLDASLITLSGLSGVVLTPGVPVRIHAGRKVRIDSGAYLSLQLASVPGPTGQNPAAASPSFGGSRSDNVAGLSVPVSVLYDITEPIHVGVSTGFAIDDFSDVDATAHIPLGIFAGYAIAGKDGPILDIDPFFTFTSLFLPGPNPSLPGGDASVAAPTEASPHKLVDTGDYVIGVSVGGFLYL
jgi:hypothetical protein